MRKKKETLLVEPTETLEGFIRNLCVNLAIEKDTVYNADGTINYEQLDFCVNWRAIPLLLLFKQGYTKLRYEATAPLLKQSFLKAREVEELFDDERRESWR